MLRLNPLSVQPSMATPYMYEPLYSDSDCDSEEDHSEEHTTQGRLQVDVSEWCSCGHCVTMSTKEENICCRELPQVERRLRELPVPQTCMTMHPGLDPVCLNPYSLQNSLNIYRALHGSLREVNGYNARSRYLAYRSFVSWVWGYLGNGNRVIIPSCVVCRVRQEFPDEQARYTGFQPPLD